MVPDYSKEASNLEMSEANNPKAEFLMLKDLNIQKHCRGNLKFCKKKIEALY
jgi:hypothetical protein